MSRIHFAGAALVAAIDFFAPVARAQTFQDALVQPGTLAAPERASIAGSLANQSFGPESLAQGSFSLPLPLAFPEDRGPLLWSIAPSYAPGAGLDIWGQGFSAGLSIARTRYQGFLDGDSDDFVTPWGRMTEGDDGYYYLEGMAEPMRFSHTADDAWTVLGADGTRYVFEPLIVAPRLRAFEWHLVRVASVTGYLTTLAYHYEQGRRYLTSVAYGGRDEASLPYAIALGYEPVTTVVRDHAFGYERRLVQRVATVTATTRRAGGTAMDETWSYALGYRAATYGPTFFLTSVQRRFAPRDGARAVEPAVTYLYDDGAEHLRTVQAQVYEPLSAFLAAQVRGGSWLQPRWTAAFDDDRDGVASFENAETNTELSFDGVSWSSTPVVAAPDADSRCGPAPRPVAPPRALSQIFGPEDETFVVRIRSGDSGPGPLSDVAVCHRDGRLLGAVIVPGAWDLGATTKLTDVNRDHLPDLVRYIAGRLLLHENVSTGGVVAFGPVVEQRLEPPVPASAVWIHDLDGDGWGDLVVKGGGGLFVWHGLATGGFASVGVRMYLWQNGERLPTSVEFSFVDANADGLVDVVVQGGHGSVRLFVNDGDAFHFVSWLDRRMPGGVEGMPLAVGITDSGETEVAFSARREAYVLPLTTPSTGMLASAHDGRGNAVAFSYRRAEPTPGLPQRTRVLAAVTHRSTGLDDVTWTYDMSAPVIHPEGRVLVGFEAVVREGPEGTHEQQFFHDAELRNLPTFSRHAWVGESNGAGATSVFEDVTEIQYEEASYLGVRLRRPLQTSSGMRRAGGPLHDVVTTRYGDYARGVCARRSVETSAHGSLTRDAVLDIVAGLPSELQCLTATEIVSGRHADASLDFVEAQRVQRNALGQPTRILRLDGARERVLQVIGYDAVHRPETVSVPGHGTTTLAYDGEGRLDSVTAPDGVVMQAGYEAREDLVETLATLRDSVRYQQSFGYDSFRRLSASWDSFRGGSATAPLSAVEYVFATERTLGAIRAETVMDVATGARSEAVSWQAANGTELATGVWTPDQRGVSAWAVGELVVPWRSQLASATLLPPRKSSDWRTMTMQRLAAGTQYLAVSSSTGGGDLRVSERLAQGPRDLAGRDLAAVTVATDAWRDVTSRGVLSSSRQAGRDALISRTLTSAGNVVEVVNPDGDTTRFAYDVAGRLRRVTLADGSTHEVAFDGFGRPDRISRDGVGTIAFTYEDAPEPTDRIATKSFTGDGDTAPTRTITYTHDDIGRVDRERHRSGGENIDYVYGHDGTGVPEPGQTGRTTEVTGPDYQRQTVYNADGSVDRQVVTLAVWRRITTDYRYNAGGEVTREVMVVRDLATNTDAYTSALVREYDPHGRLARVLHNGRELAHLRRDDLGRVTSAELGGDGDKTLAMLYDDATRGRAGYWIDASAWNAGIDWSYDDRGLVDFELLTLNDAEHLRDYGYDDRGYLTSNVETGGAREAYAYDDTGLISRVEDAAGTRVMGSGRTRTIGGVLHRYDSLGRLVERGDLAMSYGADGQLRRAARGATTWAFAYDETGNRILKRENGTIVAGYAAGLHLEPTRIVSPVRVAGILVGVLVTEAGITELELLATDSRGSVVVEPDGTKNISTAYGVRARHPELAAALDYVEKGYDADLALVRMGVRDYDPLLGQFTTPDPLFLQEPSKCGESPAECNLFGYARGNPVSFVDPLGLGSNWKADVIEDLGPVGGAVFIGSTYLFLGAGLVVDGAEWLANRTEAKRHRGESTLPELGMAIVGAPAAALGKVGFALSPGAQRVAALVGIAQSENEEQAGAAIVFGSPFLFGRNGLLRPLTPLVGPVATPYGAAAQAMTTEALAARVQVAQGARLWRIGTTGRSAAGEAQFWSLEHPLSPGFAARYGVPPANVASANFIESAVVKPGTPFVTRVAPPVGRNPGGGIEVVVPEGGVRLESFSIKP